MEPVATDIMIYMSAQNNLSGKADQNVADIRACVTLDRICAYILKDSLVGGSGAEARTVLYALPPSADDAAFNSSMLDLGFSKVMSSPVSFALHVRNAKQHFGKFANGTKPKQRLLFLWGHGGGLVMLDEEMAAGVSAAQANIREFAKALTLKSSSVEPFSFDVIAFDSCYMAMIETMHQFRDCTKFVLCSSTVVDAEGFPYGAIFNEMKAKGNSWNPKVAADRIADLYNEQYLALFPDGNRFLFVCEVGKTREAVAQLNKLGDEVAKLMTSGEDDDPARRAISEALMTASDDEPYAPVLRLVRMLERRLEQNIGADQLAAVREAARNLRQAVATAFSGNMGETSDRPVSPLVWAPALESSFLEHEAEYNALDSSAKGEAGWTSLWRRFHRKTEARVASEDDVGILGLPGSLTSK